MSGYFRLEVKNINRSTRNIIACASYRSDEKLYSERTNEMIKFANHSVKPDSFILTPDHAPEWTNDRQKLWNEVDKKERSVQKNSQVAREVLLSLPNDLDKNINKEIVKNFVNDEFVDKGMVADVAIHNDDNNNPHAHILLTVRPFNKDGSWGNKRKDEYVYDENGEHELTKSGRKKRRSIHAFDFNKSYLVDIRKKYAETLNEYSKRNNINKEYSSESFENQGRKELPLKRLTREEYYIENKEKQRCEKENIEYKPVTFYGKINKEIEDYNRGLIKDLEENIDNKVVDINEIIRNHKTTATVDKDNLKLIAKRNKGYVDYESAKKIYKNVNPRTSKYARSIKAEKDKLKFRKEYLLLLENSYYEDNKSVEKYGYDVKDFEKQIDIEIDKLSNDVQRFKKKKEKYNEIYTASKDVYSYFINKNREIYNEIFKNENKDYYDHSNDNINLYIKEIKNGNYVDITEISSLNYEDNEMQNIKNYDLYSVLSKELYFAKKDITKATYNLKENYNKDDLFELNYRVKEFNELKNELNEFRPHINDDLRLALNDLKLSDKQIDDLSTISKIKMIEQAIDDNNTKSNQQIFNDYKDKYEDLDQEANDIVSNFEYSDYNVTSKNVRTLSDTVLFSLDLALNDIDGKTRYTDLYNKGNLHKYHRHKDRRSRAQYYER